MVVQRLKDEWSGGQWDSPETGVMMEKTFLAWGDPSLVMLCC